MPNVTLQEEIHSDDNEINNEGSLMSASLSSNSQYTTRSCSQSTYKKRFKSNEHIVVGINKLVSTF